MSYDLAVLLTTQSQGRYTFETQYLPRKRLNQKLAVAEPGIVLWVNPVWFDDADREKYLWTAALLEDRNEVLSRHDNPVHYHDPRSLQGLKLGGVIGHTYSDIEELVAQGAVRRIDAVEERVNLTNLMLQRIDVTIMPQTAARYLLRAMQLEEKTFVSPQPHRVFARHILVSPQLPKVYQFLNKVISTLPQNATWQTILRRYGFSSTSP